MWQVSNRIETITDKMLSLFELFCVCLFLWSSAANAKTDELNRPTVGVIRWDAWNLVDGQYDFMSNYTHRYLSTKRFQYRLPFFGKILSDNNVTFDGDTQEIMD